MSAPTRRSLATDVDSELLQALEDLAHREGTELQALVDEALVDLVAKRAQRLPRPHVLSAYQASHETFSSLYKKLAE